VVSRAEKHASGAGIGCASAWNGIFVDTIPAQHKGLQQVLRSLAADVVIGDDMLFGVLPMLLGPRSERPPIVLCGTSFFALAS